MITSTSTRHSGGRRRAAGRPPTPALVLGGHITGLGVLRLLAARRIPTHAIPAPSGDVMTRSRFYRPMVEPLRESVASDRLAAYLQRVDLPSAVLLPCSDAWTCAVAGLPSAVRERFPASVAPLATVQLFVDKGRFQALMEELGIPQPRTVRIDNERDVDALSPSEIATGFLKPIDSQRFAAHYPGKGFWVGSRDEARAKVRAAREVGVSLMLQEWIPGDPHHHVLVDCFVDQTGALSGIVARRKIRMMPPRLGNTASAVTIPIAEAAEPIAATRAIVAATGYRGVFSAEFKLDDRDGRFKILEVNARLFWYVAHTAAAGLDLPWLCYRDALGLPVDRATAYRSGVYGLYELNDAAALKRSLVADRRVDGPVLRPWLLGRRALFAWSDPGPALAALIAHVRPHLEDRP